MIVRESAHIRVLNDRFARLRAAALSGAPALPARRAQLAALEAMLKHSWREIAAAIDADFGHRSVHETRLTEIFPALEASRYARRRLARWMAPQTMPVAPYLRPGRTRIVRQPLGVVGIVVPWNYPLLLALGPLVDALAAGNRAMIKMSEFTPCTGALLARLLGEVFAGDQVRVECGDLELARAFAALPFDHLLFTGSTTAGRSVMGAAARNLTPVTLELGGKSPVIIGRDAPPARAAERIMAGKCLNAGQTCIAPDYVLIPHGTTEAFIAAARSAVTRRYPRLGPPDYTSIVNDAHFDRLGALAADAVAKGASLVPLHADAPQPDRTTRIMPPALVCGVDDTMNVMHEEIFGPLLPLRTYRTLDEAIAYVNARAHPLALYYFGVSAGDIEMVLTRTTSGGACINDVMLQFAQNALPFGGIGHSGMGAYHGYAGFARFSHAKAVFEQAPRSPTGLLAPPYGRRFEALLGLLTRSH